MPSPILAIDLIKTAMRLKGIIATGETPSAEKATDGLRALNDVLETWSNQPYAVWGASPLTFPVVAGQSTYTMGRGGDWGTDRPIGIGGGTITYAGAISGVSRWTLAEFLGVDPADRSTLPERVLFIAEVPLARVVLWPTPSVDATITLAVPRVLQQVAKVSDTLILPPGYARALQYAVAEELGPQYGSPLDLSAAARSSLALLKRANRQSPVATFDPALTGRGGRGGGGFTGGTAPDQWSEIEW